MGETLKIETYKSETPTVVTIGTFDGVHVGHQKIIKRLIAIAKREGLHSVILTFFPHPRMVLQKDANIKLINTIEERSKILQDLGLDFLVIKQFTKGFSRLSAEDFVKTILIDKLHIKKVIIGYDHRFGRNRNADIKDLKRFGLEFGFGVEEISVQDINDVAVSSTKIRNAILNGNIVLANTYLGYSYMLTGNVVRGRGIGKQLEYPTANLDIVEPYKLIPKYGVYIVKSQLEGATVFGMMNIGTNPTVNGDKETIEVHFFDFNKPLYGQRLKVEILERIRDEQKFDSVSALQLQLQNDKQFSLNFIKHHNAK